MRRQRALPFLLLAFGFAWAAWFSAAARAAGRGDGGLLGNGGPLFLLGVFAPALAAIGLTLSATGQDGVLRLVSPIGRWRVAVRWYLFALSYFIVLKLGAALLQRVATGEWPEFGRWSLPVLLGGVLVSTWSQAGEEVGWRGYLLPLLTNRMGLGAGGILVGLIWALWHLPLFYLEGSGSAGQSFPLYASHVTALSVAMTWLYWRTGRSLLLVMVMHAAVNNTTGIVVSAVPGASSVWTLSGSFAGWSTAGLSWLVAIGLLRAMRGGTLETGPAAAGPQPPPMERPRHHST